MRTSHIRLIAAVIGLAVAVPLIVLLFTGPASRGKPHDVPIGVAGPPAAAAQVEQRLSAAAPGGFEVHSYNSEAELIEASRERKVYGGIVLSAQPHAVIATGASPVVGPMITSIATEINQGHPVRSVDVAPPAADDPRGAGFGAIVFPVFLSGMALALSAVLVAGHPRVVAIALPIGAAVVGAAAIGAAMWIGVLPGGFASQWLAMSAGMLAIGSVVAGLVQLFGTRGIAPAGLLFMLVGMPLAGIAAPPEFLPHVWSLVGQSLPIGATGTALRSAAFFGDGALVGAGAWPSFVVLAAWTVLGYALLVIGDARHRAAHRGAPSSDEPEEKDLPVPATI